MATIRAAGAGNYSNGATWVGGVVPGDGDTIVLEGYVVTMDITRVPATGTLAAITDPGKAGRIDVPMNTLGSCAIYATAITCGTSTDGIVNMTGAAPAATLTVGEVGNTCNITGGTAANSSGISNNSTAAITIVGNLASGSGAASRALQNLSTGTVTITGDITGGNGFGFSNNSTGSFVITGNITGGSNAVNNSQGFFNLSSGSGTITGTVTGGSAVSTATGRYTTLGVCNTSGNITLVGNMVNTAQACAWGGRPPSTWTIGATNYVKWGSTYLYDETLRNTDPTEALVFTGTSYKIYNVAKTGAFDEAGRNTDPGESNVKLATGYKILNVAKTGTYVAAVTIPAAPDITVANDGTGTSVTVTIDGPAGATNYVYYLLPGAASWTAGGNRAGDGDIVVGSLTEGKTYEFVAVAYNGTAYSLPSEVRQMRVTTATTQKPLVESALYYHLTNDTQVAAAISTRAYPLGEVPEGTAYPYITWRRISAERLRHTTGTLGVTKATYRIACFARTSKSSQDIAEDVRDCMDHYRGDMGDPTDPVTVKGVFLADDTTEPVVPLDASERGPNATVQDYIIWHTEAEPST